MMRARPSTATSGNAGVLAMIIASMLLLGAVGGAVLLALRSA